jgi:hypothetical protein
MTIRNDPNLPENVGIDTETGEFVSLEDEPGMGSTQVMADGGVPHRVIEQSYPGSEAYSDIQQVVFDYGATNSNTGGDQTNTETSIVFDLDNLLDRREEMADLLHLDVSMAVVVGRDDDAIDEDGGGGGFASAILAAPQPDGSEPVNLAPEDFVNIGGDDATMSSTDSEEPLCRPLKGGVGAGFEDETNGAGGGDSGAVVDSTTVSGWQMSDPSFEARDEIGVAAKIQSQAPNDVDIAVSISGQLTFGLYEVQTTEVVR